MLIGEHGGDPMNGEYCDDAGAAQASGETGTCTAPETG